MCHPCAEKGVRCCSSSSPSLLSPRWHCNDNMKQEDNTEGRQIKPFFPLSLLFRTQCQARHTGLSDLSAQLAMGARGRCYCARRCLAAPLLAQGRREKTEAKQDAGVQWEPETFVIKMEMRLFVDEGVSASHCLWCQPSERLL